MQSKYPIILVHGIAIKDIFFVRAFGNIDKILTKEGHKVYISKIDGFGTIENNARVLKEEILKVLKEENCEKVNLIAHSKGGLDCKYLITHLAMEDRIASLTTLCTPFKGSPIAFNILKAPTWLLKYLAFFIDLFYRIFGDKNPDCYRVCKQLSGIENIATNTINFTGKVYCQSYSSTLKSIKDDFIMGIPLMFYRYFEKKEDSDGLVSNDSSNFGEYKGDAIDESTSHSQMIDFMVNKKKKEKIYAFYIQLCKELVEKGF